MRIYLEVVSFRLGSLEPYATKWQFSWTRT